ncbi:MAG: hypothetical protein K8T25_08760 [Planctomycetia bacterium]|nr:hypothetical protein [Planctomycetia bacterium]
MTRQFASIAVLLATLLAMTTAGCRRNKPPKPSPPPAPPSGTWIRLRDQPALEVQRDDARAIAVRMDGGPAIPFHQGVALIDDRMVVEVSPGETFVVRQPTAIAKEASSLPHVYIRDGEETLVTTPGFKGEPYVDPRDRKLCWSARTCTNPECPSRKLATSEHPFLYSVRVPQFLVDKDGNVTTDGSVFSWPSVACPHCGQVNSTKNWAPDDATRRADDLAQELSRVRQMRELAEKANAGK